MTGGVTRLGVICRKEVGVGKSSLVMRQEAYVSVPSSTVLSFINSK